MVRSEQISSFKESAQQYHAARDINGRYQAARSAIPTVTVAFITVTKLVGPAGAMVDRANSFRSCFKL
jgi:TRAP-type uncharacterized transport system substrate-binding protein